MHVLHGLETNSAYKKIPLFASHGRTARRQRREQVLKLWRCQQNVATGLDQAVHVAPKNRERRRNLKQRATAQQFRRIAQVDVDDMNAGVRGKDVLAILCRQVWAVSLSSPNVSCVARAPKPNSSASITLTVPGTVSLTARITPC